MPLLLRILRGLRFAFVVGVLGFLGLSVVAVVAYRFVPPPATPLMLIRVFQDGARHGLWEIRRNWTAFERIPPDVFRAVIAAEDARFCEHMGIDVDALREAWQDYRFGRKRMRGASTISMQTAKNLFLWPERSLLRKGLEAWFTLLMELAWSKQRIVEVYVNVVEWGDGVYGIGAAARHHFGKAPRSLTRSEAARLAAALPNPRTFSAGRPSAHVLARAATIRARMPAAPVVGRQVCP